jgi:hypothetical protein
MPEKTKRTPTRAKLVPADQILHEPAEAEDSFDASFLAEFRENLASALTPSKAVDLIAKLMAEAPAASKDQLERIKVLDKLLNTARALMESRLKMDEAAAISARLDELEARIESLSEKMSGPTSRT